MSSITYQKIVDATLLVACLIAAAVLIHHFRRYFQSRQKGETVGEYLQRATKEHARDRAAELVMFGSLAPPNVANFITVVFLCSLMWTLTRVQYLGLIQLAYLMAGLVFTRKMASRSRTAEHHRLQWNSRLWFRLFFACIWPACFFRIRKR